MTIWVSGQYSFWFTFVVNYAWLTALWVLLEQLIYSETQPSSVDAIILAICCFMYASSAG